jgi:hypothetical protein
VINAALESLDFEYTIASFFRDLAWIREQTFTTASVKSAFRKAGMVPPSQETVKSNMRKYYRKPQTQVTEDSGLPSLTKITSDLAYVEYRADNDYADVMSSPMRNLIRDIRRNATTAIYDGERARVEAINLFSRVNELTTKKPHSKKRVQQGGQLTAKIA